MSEQPTAEQVISDEQLEALLAWSSGRKRPTEMPLQRKVLTAALEELKRHRELEHANYWDDSDD